MKKGRSTKGLGLGEHQDKMKLDDKRKEYLEKLELARKSSSNEELLSIYVEFYSWLRRSCNDSEKAKLLLEVSFDIFISEQSKHTPLFTLLELHQRTWTEGGAEK